MRLGSCVALELSLGATLVAALGGGLLWASGELRDLWEREAHAAERTAAALSPVHYEPAPEGRLAPLRRRVGLFRGVADDVLLAPLRQARIESVKFNDGGTSISLRIEFDSGARAAFKPQQLNLQSRPRREIAAFRIDRLLGIGSVPPAFGRRFPVSEILDNLDPESVYYVPRLKAEMIAEEGQVAGELSWWIPVIEQARIEGYLVDEVAGVVTWTRYLTQGVEIPAEHRTLLSHISNMLLFDMVINNSDRWSGRNVRASEDGELLYFMDNTLSFGNDRNAHIKVRTYLMKCQKFSRALVRRLRRLTREDLQTALGRDLGPFEFLVTEREIDALLDRRDLALAWVDELIELHGEEAVLVFP